MATTTPNYGWTVPTSTDLVKDGATAIETLGDAIDASMNTALGTKKAGMVLLNTTSFSGVASQALATSSFSATYDRYLLDINIENTTADGTVYVKLRASGTDASTNYSFALTGITGAGSANNFYGQGQTAGFPIIETDGAGSTNSWNFTRMVFNNPFLTKFTQVLVQSASLSPASTYESFTGAGTHTTASSYDSINIIATAGNISGVAYLYGMNK